MSQGLDESFEEFGGLLFGGMLCVGFCWFVFCGVRSEYGKLTIDRRDIVGVAGVLGIFLGDVGGME